MRCVLQLHLAEDGADAQRLGVLAGYLRAELPQLDVEAVTLRKLCFRRHVPGASLLTARAATGDGTWRWTMSQTSAEPTSIDVPACAKCGAPVEEYAGTGPTLMTSDAHVIALTRLFAGELDGRRCAHCGTVLPLWPTLIVRFAEANVIEMLQGSQFPAAGDMATADVGVEIHVWATVPELRTAVVRRMTPAIRTATEIWAGGRDTDRLLAYVEQRCQKLTPEVFTAGQLAISGRIPGVEVRYPSGADARESESFNLGLLAIAQARAWLRLALAWSDRKPPFERTFEQDLGRYVSLDADLRAAASWLTRFLEGFPDTVSPRDRYILEALRAYVCYAAKVPNEFADRWAEWFVGLELQSGSDEPLRFSDGLARETVTRKSMARVVADILPHADQSVIEALDAICCRIGEDTLVEDVFFDGFRGDADTDELVAPSVRRCRPDRTSSSKRVGTPGSSRDGPTATDSNGCSPRSGRSIWTAPMSGGRRSRCGPDGSTRSCAHRAHSWRSSATGPGTGSPGSTPGSAPGCGRSGRPPCARRSVTPRRWPSQSRRWRCWHRTIPTISSW